MSRDEYLLARPAIERLQLQSRVWEPAGGNSSRRSATDPTRPRVGCGALGRHRILSEWVGPSGPRVGFDIDEALMPLARFSMRDGSPTSSSLSTICSIASRRAVIRSRPRPDQIAPLGRAPEQVGSHKRTMKPGGKLSEEWDPGSKHCNPPAPATERLIRPPSVRRPVAEAVAERPDCPRDGFDEPEIAAQVIASSPATRICVASWRNTVGRRAPIHRRHPARMSSPALYDVDRRRGVGRAGHRGTTFTLIHTGAGGLDGALPGASGLAARRIASASRDVQARFRASDPRH